MMGNFSRFINFEVGNGHSIHFPHDLWCTDVILKETFKSWFEVLEIYRYMWRSKRIGIMV